MKRTLSLVLALTLIFSAMLGLVSTADASTETGSLEISQASLKFADTVYLLVAVDYTAAFATLEEAAEAVTLKITNTVDGSVITLAPDADVVLKNHVCFTYTDLGAKNFGDELSLQAFVDGKESGESKKYSILEYAIKGMAGDDALMATLCEDMLAFGDAAQSAFDCKANATYDLAKDYGIVVVNGSTEGKKIAEVGSSVAFTANTAKTGANAALYDDSFAKVDGITVAEGYTRYIYVGDSQRTIINLDMTMTTEANFGNYPTVKDNKSAAAYVDFFTNASKTADYIWPDKDTTKTAKFATTIYAIDNSNNNRKGVVTSTIVPGSHWMLSADANQSVAIQLAASFKAALNASNDGVFTMVFTLGKDGTTNMTTANNRLRGSSSQNVSNYFVIKNDGSNSIICGIEQNNNKWGQAGAKDPVPVATIKGVEGEQNFITFYVVVNPKANTYTYYAQGSNSVVTTNASFTAGKTIADVMANTAGGLMDWTMAPMNTGTTLIRRMVFLSGNIFE